MIWRIVHHAIAHPLMAVLPEKWGTSLHDWTGRKGWPDEDKPHE